MNYLKLLVLGLGLVFIQNGFGQQIIRSNISVLGSQYSDGNYSISQTVGQSSNTAVFEQQSKTVRQGFQQPLKSISKAEPNEIINYALYPNPSNGIFTMNIETAKNEAFDFEIINILGATIYKDVAYSEVKKTVNISHLAGGVYLLRITENKHSLGEIKIIKY